MAIKRYLSSPKSYTIYQTLLELSQLFRTVFNFGLDGLEQKLLRANQNTCSISLTANQNWALNAMVRKKHYFNALFLLEFQEFLNSVYFSYEGPSQWLYSIPVIPTVPPTSWDIIDPEKVESAKSYTNIFKAQIWFADRTRSLIRSQ